jgi:tRNA(fMet)-specific endonuclease VapC
MVVLDTDHVTLVEWGQGEDAQRLRARLEQFPAEERATTIITFEEQTRGWLAYLARARTVAEMVKAFGKLSRHLDVYRPMQVLRFDERAAAEFQRLHKLRLRIGTKDLQIAAVVLARGATLLSRNLSDFRQVPGLTVEDWTTPPEAAGPPDTQNQNP